MRWASELYEGKVLEPSYLKQLLDDSNRIEDPAAYAYGLGVFIYDTKVGRAYGHSGWTPGYMSSMLYFPGSRTAVAFQTNTDRAGKPRNYLLELAEVVVKSGVARQPAAQQGAAADGQQLASIEVW